MNVYHIQIKQKITYNSCSLLHAEIVYNEPTYLFEEGE